MAEHSHKRAAVAASSTNNRNTYADETARAEGVTRAKPLPHPSANPLMHLRRCRAARVFSAFLALEKTTVRAALLGVSEALVAMWVDAAMVDRKPVPLAVLWALDEEGFERLVEAVRADREAQREGR